MTIKIGIQKKFVKFNFGRFLGRWAAILLRKLKAIVTLRDLRAVAALFSKVTNIMR